MLLDLPVGPMSLAERVTAVRTVREGRLRRGDADASAFVLRAMNILPSPLQRAIARTSFSSRRFSLIVSVFPGTRQRLRLLGAEVTEVTWPEGFGDPLRQWPLYMLLIVGPIGFLLNQDAFQAGRLISPVLAIITTVDPLVSICIAHFWLKEKVASAPGDIAAEVISLAVMAGGIVALAHRAPHVGRHVPEPEEMTKPAHGAAGDPSRQSPRSCD